MSSEPALGQRREARFERVWYGGEPSPLGWRLVSLIYRFASATRRLLYWLRIRRAYRAPVPTIVVGNVTVGGTGKTPLVIWLSKQLAHLDYRPGVISRGYGAEVDQPRIVEVDMPVSLCGDEPLMMARRGLKVAVCANRALAADMLLKRGCNVLIADDGLQHYRLARDLEIAVIDGSRGLGNGRLLPAGPLREPASRLSKVDFVVVNGGAEEVSFAATPMSLSGNELIHAASGQSQPASEWRGRQVHAVAGIGNPERFFSALEDLDMEIERHAFSDHHLFDPDELLFGDDKAVVTTEKDAVRIQATDHIWYLPVNASLPQDFAAKLVATLNGSA